MSARWDSDEVNQLEIGWHSKTSEELAEQIGRSVGGVIDKAKRMGLGGQRQPIGGINSTRNKVLEIVRRFKGGAIVTDVIGELGIHQTLASYHLNHLAKEGKVDRNGRLPRPGGRGSSPVLWVAL